MSNPYDPPPAEPEPKKRERRSPNAAELSQRAQALIILGVCGLLVAAMCGAPILSDAACLGSAFAFVQSALLARRASRAEEDELEP